MFTVAWVKIKEWMDGSVFFRLIERFMGFLARFFGGSVIASGVRSDIDHTSLSNSTVYRSIYFVLAIPEKARDKWAYRAWQGSYAVERLSLLPQYVLSLSLRHIGYGIFAGLLIFAAFSYAASQQITTGIIEYAVIFAAALCCLNTERLYFLIKNSALMRFLCYLFDFSFPKLNIKRSVPAIPVLYCAACGTLFSVMQPLYAASFSAGVPIALIVIRYPFIGVLGVVFLMPFMPTMVIAALIVGVCLLFLLKLLTNKTYCVKLDLIGVFICIFIIITLFKGVTSLHRQTSLNIALLTSLFMSVYIPIVSLTNTRRKLELLMLSFSTSALFTGIYGLLQVLSGQRVTTWVDKEMFKDLGNRVFSTFANPNVYGTYLLIAIPICAAGVVIARRVLLKLYYAAVTGVLVVNLALTYSRGCYLAIALAVVVFILLMEKRLIALASAGVFLLPVLLPQSIMNRLLSIGNMEDSSSQYRLSIYQASVRVLKRFWYVGLGQGPEAFNRVFPLYAFNAVTAQHSHNLFLQVFIETGAAGFIAFLLIIYAYFKTLFPFFRSCPNIKHRVLSAALIAMMCGFILQSLFDYTFYNYKVYMLFFAALAFARALANTCAVKDRLKKDGQ